MKTACVTVRDQSRVAEARREATALAAQARFNPTDTGKVALVATEAATNLIRHAGGGDLLATLRDDGALEILALDKGPGIVDLEKSLRDGYSTVGGSGTGLGAIARLSSEFHVYSPPGRGTALLARLRSGNGSPASASAISYGGVSVPMQGERVCGDTWSIAISSAVTVVMVADGLGHGQQAADASAEAARIFQKNAYLPQAELMDFLHAALRGTRGAAIAVARLLPGRRQVEFAGLGNISGLIHAGGASRAMISHPGTVGHTPHKATKFTYPWPAGALLLLYSDGINSHLSFEGYPRLAEQDPSLIAGVFFRDFNRSRDDSTVVALRERLP